MAQGWIVNILESIGICFNIVPDHFLTGASSGNLRDTKKPRRGDLELIRILMILKVLCQDVFLSR